MASDEFVLDVAVQGARIVFRDGGMIGKFRHGPEQVRRAAMIASQSMAPEVENYMKSNAPWNDQTGNARNGLFARAYSEGDETGIILGHSVDYGIWLEVRWSGRYAIIEPAIAAMGPAVMRRHERILERI